jgi:hypothetical protein
MSFSYPSSSSSDYSSSSSSSSSSDPSLSYFSKLFNNSNIIDIGTHLGHSALALSYNDTNTIYTFDIVDKVETSIKNTPNIKFCYDNLFDKNVFNKWKDIRR